MQIINTVKTAGSRLLMFRTEFVIRQDVGISSFFSVCGESLTVTQLKVFTSCQM